MTDDPVVFYGTYADIVTRKTRSAAVVHVEIPIESMEAFIAAFGAPLPGKEVPVVIARLDPKAAPSAPRKPPSAAAPPAPREPGKYASFPLAKQAAIRCATPEFWRFLEFEFAGTRVKGETSAAELVRSFCRVNSRKEILPDTEASAYWLELDDKFLEWRHFVPLAEPTR